MGLFHSIFNPELMAMDWTDRGKHDAIIPERMIALDHAKGLRLVMGQVAKYQMILPLLQPGSKILDPCTGSGFGASILARSGHSVVGIEIDPTMADFAAKRQDITVVQQSIFNCSKKVLPDNHYDAITLVDAIEHFTQEDQLKVMKILYKTLKPGGILLADTILAKTSRRVSRMHLWELTWDDFETVFNSAGEWQNVRRYYNCAFHKSTSKREFYFPIWLEAQPNVVRGFSEQIIIGTKNAG